MIQYTIVIKRPELKGYNSEPKEPYFFVNCDDDKHVIDFVSSKMKDGLKVHTIYMFQYNGILTEMTIGFEDGVLSLIHK